MSAINQLAALDNPGIPDAITAAEALTGLLTLDTVGRRVTGARIVGQGGSASADLRLDDGTVIEFETLRDFARPALLRVEVAAATGAKPKLNADKALDALALLRALAEHERTASADDHAAEWGLTYLQAAEHIHADIADQAERWGAFKMLGQRDPAYVAREVGGGIAKASIVLVDQAGVRLVRTGWFRGHVRESDPGIAPPAIAQRMRRIGWVLRGAHGRIKATCPSRPEALVWTFYEVPAEWEASVQVNAGERSNARGPDVPRARDKTSPAFTRSPGQAAS